MSWVTIIWSMTASACFTLAAIQLLVWCHRRTEWGSLLFSLTSVAVAIFAGIEFRMMRADTPEQFAAGLRWMQIPTWVIVLSLVGFVRFYLRAGRAWLGWTVCALRTVALLLNFVVGQNLNYLEVTRLRHIPFLGEPVSVAVGVSNPCMIFGQLSLLFLVIFTADAVVAVWRRGDRRQALVTGGSIVFFTVMGLMQAVLVLWQVVHWPLTASFFFLGIVVAMGYEMSLDTFRAAQLAHDLLENEKRMKLTTEAAKMGVWIRDLERDEIWASEGWRALFGFDGSEKLNLDRMLARLHPDDREIVRRTLANAVAGDDHYEREFRVVLPDGRLRWLAARVHFEFNGKSKPVLLRGVALDITRQKEADAELHERRNELAHLSRVTMLGELSGSLAHELNQPLAAILSNAQAAQRYLAKDPPNLAEVREILTDIASEDERAGKVIQRLRLLLKKGQVQMQSIDANEVVLEVLKLARSDLANHSVTVETALAPGSVWICSDRVQIQQVILNLVMNACDAMADNAQKDRLLTLRTHANGDGRVRIEVSDVGRGLPGGSAERAFERFFTTKPQGLGLGLSVCRTIIAAHGGTIGATNNAERGATFHMNLPSATEPPT